MYKKIENEILFSKVKKQITKFVQKNKSHFQWLLNTNNISELQLEFELGKTNIISQSWDISILIQDSKYFITAYNDEHGEQRTQFDVDSILKGQDMEQIRINKSTGNAYLQHNDTLILLPDYITDEFSLFNGDLTHETDESEIWSISEDEYAEIINTMLKRK